MTELDPIEQEIIVNIGDSLRNMEALIMQAERTEGEFMRMTAAVEAAQHAIDDLEGKTINVRTVFTQVGDVPKADIGAGNWLANALVKVPEVITPLRELQNAIDEVGLSEEEAATLARLSGSALFRQGEEAKSKADKLRELMQQINVVTDSEASFRGILLDSAQAARVNAAANADAGNAAAAAGRTFRIWGTGITLTGYALHRVTTAAFDLLAVVIPASVALAAFGAAAAPTVQEIYQSMKALNTTTTAFSTHIYPLTGAFQQVADAVQPQVYTLFGEALYVAGKKTDEFSKLAQGAATVMVGFGARIAAALTSSGVSAFMKNAVNDLQGLGDLIGNIFGTIGNLLKIMPGYATTVLYIFRDLAGVLEAISASPFVQTVLSWGLALHGAWIWATVFAAGAVWLGNSLAGLAAKFGLATEGALAFDAVQFGAGLNIMGNALRDGAIALVTFAGAEDVAAAGTTLLDGALVALDAVNPMVWIGAAIGGLIALGLWLSNATSATNAYNTAVNNALSNAPVTKFGIDLTQQQATTTQLLAQAQQKLASTQEYATVFMGRAGGNMRVVTGAYQQQLDVVNGYRGELQMLSGYQGRYNELLKAAGGNVAFLNQAGITSQQIMNASAGQMQQYIIEVQGAANAQKALALGIGRAAASQNAQTNEFMTQTLPALQQVTQAEDAVINVITSGRAAFDTFQQGIGTLAQNFAQVTGSTATVSERLGTLQATARLAGASLGGTSQASYALNAAFYQEVQNGQKMIDTLQQQDISTGNLQTVVATAAKQMLSFAGNNTEARSVIEDLINNALGPGTVSLQSMDKWVGNNSTSLQGMNSIIAESTIKAGTLANTLESQLNAQFRTSLLQYTGATADLQQYTKMLATNQADTAAGQAIRAQLIRDLENAGFSAQDATRYVDGLGRSLNNLPTSKNVAINVTTYQQMVTLPGTGPGIPAGIRAPGHAAGYRVPGYGGGDRVPALLEGGEAVVPKHLVGAVAPFLSAHGVPGFAAGGILPGGGGRGGPAGGGGVFWGHHPGGPGGGSGGPFHQGLTPMEMVIQQWAREIWAQDLHKYGKNSPIALKQMEALFGATRPGKGGLWSNPQYRYMEANERQDMMKYFLGDTMYWKLANQLAASRKSESRWERFIGSKMLQDMQHGRTAAAVHEAGFLRWLMSKDNATQFGIGMHMNYLLSELGYGFSKGGRVPFGHYDSGGYLPQGLSLALNTTGRPEPVGGGAPQVIHVHVEVGGREVASAMVPGMVGAVNRYSIRNSGKATGILRPS